MSEFWVSQPRHFCEFCKCWIADNRPSKDFHEKGKRHQENVKKKISDVRKKAVENEREKEEMSEYMREMEAGALHAFKKDIASNPALAAQYGAKIKTAEEKKQEAAAKEKEKTQKVEQKEEPKKVENKEEAKVEKTETETKEATESAPEATPDDWDETVSPEGHTYYWHIVTGEVSWIAPVGYVPPSQRKAKPETSATESQPSKDQSPEAKASTSTQETDEEVPEDESSTSQEPEEPKEPEQPLPNMPTAPNRPDKRSVYGRWETTAKVEEPVVDLQLPVPTGIEEEVKAVPIKEPKMKFREKKVTSLAEDDWNKKFVAFKKRKLNSGVRNLKTREPDS